MPIKEIDLYMPVKNLLLNQGYSVKSEVNECDIMAIKGQEVVVVELKLHFNLELVLQGIERQRMINRVYLAIPAPRRINRRWYSIQRLCRRLYLGLITVCFSNQPPKCNIVLDIGAAQPRKNKKGRDSLLAEFHNRSGDYNLGGTNGQGIITAYREQALRVAWVIDSTEEKTCRLTQIKQVLKDQKVGRILQNNVYGWFSRVERGMYSLTPDGEEALQKYKYVVDTFGINIDE